MVNVPGCWRRISYCAVAPACRFKSCPSDQPHRASNASALATSTVSGASLLGGWATTSMQTARNAADRGYVSAPTANTVARSATGVQRKRGTSMTKATDEAHVLSDLLKSAIMTPLQQRVAEAGVCPKCHTKTTTLRHEAEGMSFEQCTDCLTVWVLPCGVP